MDAPTYPSCQIVIVLYILDMSSGLCVPYVAVGIYCSDHHQNCTYRTCGQCCVFCKWVAGSNIVIGRYVLDTWSVLCVPYVGVGI